MLKNEYQLDFFTNNDFVRLKCSKCGGFFWTRNQNRLTCGDMPCDTYTFIDNPVFKKKYELSEMREHYLNFFEERGHTRIDRYPVVARWRDDIYLTIASIADFQPFVTSGEVPPPANPLVISQPCIRLVDIDAVGKSGRHLTTFEMMAHHAFNNKDSEIYWKDRTVELCDELLDSLGADLNAVTYKESPWAGGGNAGPCLEVMIAGLEVATLVFMDLKEDESGSIAINNETYSKMDNYIVDTGYGLERFVCASKGSPTIYDAIFPSIINKLTEFAGIDHKLDDPEYASILAQNARLSGVLDISEKANVYAIRKKIANNIGTTVEKLTSIMEPVESVYAIADFTRCLTFMIGDGIIPSNVKSGYLARLLYRRTHKLMQDLNIKIPISEIVEMHIKNLPEYPEFKDKFEIIDDILYHEEQKFNATLKRGKRMVRDFAKEYKKQNEKIPLNKLIELYDSHGIPPEISKSVAKEYEVEVELPDNFHSLVVDRHGKAEKKKIKEIPYKDKISKLPATKLMFYEELERLNFEAVVLDVFDDKVILDSTLFYPEGGGQPADFGTIIIGDIVLEVIGVEIIDDVVLHKIKGTIDKLYIKKGDIIIGKVDKIRRIAHTRHHTATHIINNSAKKVLGDHIWQTGAQKYTHSAHIDLSHYKRITQDELNEIELIANQVVMENRRNTIEIMERSEAEKKYGFVLYQGGVPSSKKIRVLKVGKDIEACAGTHCVSTGCVGPIKILKSERIQDGVERITYAAGDAAVLKCQELVQYLSESASVLNVSNNQLPSSVNRFFEEWKQFKKENVRLKDMLAQVKQKSMIENAIDINGISVITEEMPKLTDYDELTKIAGGFIKENGRVVIFISECDGVKIIVAASKDVVKKGINAGEIAKNMSLIVSGGGGGRADMARGGGTDISKMQEALDRGIEVLKGNFKE